MESLMERVDPECPRVSEWNQIVRNLPRSASVAKLAKNVSLEAIQTFFEPLLTATSSST